MGRLIDADKINIKDVIGGESEFAQDIRDAVKDLIDHQPTIDAEPVRHGHWEEIRNAYGELEGWICECGCEVKSASNYCPNCGVKMDADCLNRRLNIGKID